MDKGITATPPRRATASLVSDPTALVLLLWPIVADGPRLLQISYQTTFVAAAAVYVLGMGLARLARGRTSAASQFQPTTLLVAGLLGLVALSIFRAPAIIMETNGKIALAGQVLLFFAIAFLAFLDVTPDVRRRRFRALLLSLPLLVAVSVALWPTLPSALRMNEPISIVQMNKTLQIVGMQVSRLRNLPGLQGSSTIAMLSATSILALAYLAATSRAWRVGYLILIVPSAIALVMTDARAIIVELVVAAAIYLSPLSRAVWVTRAILILAVFSAPVLLALQRLTAAIGANDAIIRTGGGERFGALTGRDVVWQAAFSELGHPKVAHLLGYGQFGDLVTGISSSYAWMFYGLEGRASYHNAFLQYVLDSGYLSAVLYFAAMWTAITAFARGALDPRTSRLLLAIIALTLTGGFSEAIGTVRHLDLFTLLVALLTFATLLPRQRSATNAVPGRQARQRAGVTRSADGSLPEGGL